MLIEACLLPETLSWSTRVEQIDRLEEREGVQLEINTTFFMLEFKSTSEEN